MSAKPAWSMATDSANSNVRGNVHVPGCASGGSTLPANIKGNTYTI